MADGDENGKVIGISISDPTQIKPLKNWLSENGLLHTDIKISRNDDDNFVIPLSCSKNRIPRDIAAADYQLVSINNIPKASPLPISKWSLYPPMVLLPSNSPTTDFSQSDIDRILKQFGGGRDRISHIAKNSPISDKTDVVRKPRIVPVHGDFGPIPTEQSIVSPTEEDFENAFWVQSTQNNIIQCWAPQYTMFSRGNIHEKTRVLTSFSSQAPIENNTIIDMYAGIGYFTLAYAAHRPSRIYCWELNPWSVRGLIKGARSNGYSIRLIRHGEEYVEVPEEDFIIVFLEDNKHAIDRMRHLVSSQPPAPLSHINLGLLPDCKLSWEDSLQIAQLLNRQNDKCIIHIHENVSNDALLTYPKDTLSKLHSICPTLSIKYLHLEKIKTFAPGIWHICTDYEIIKI